MGRESVGRMGHSENLRVDAPTTATINGKPVEYVNGAWVEKDYQPSSFGPGGCVRELTLPERVEDMNGWPANGEVRVADPNTGGEKGQKLARFDLIPSDVLWEYAEHFGYGARKYADRNWQRGYKWSLSYAAALRHLNQFWNGEDRDPETGSKHVIAAMWHCAALAWFMDHYPDGDDRWKE